MKRLPARSKHAFRKMVAKLVPRLMHEHGYSAEEARKHARAIAAARCFAVYGKGACERRAQAVRRLHASMRGK